VSGGLIKFYRSYCITLPQSRQEYLLGRVRSPDLTFLSGWVSGAAAAPGKKLDPAARRALEEAEARRRARAAADEKRPSETAGPKGAEPTRFGDWERGGIAYDF